MPTNQFVIIASMRAKADKIDEVRKALLEMVAATRAENGCVLYDLHQDLQDPAEFFFYEVWTSPEVWQAHMESPHLKAFGAIADTLLERSTRVQQLKQIES